VQNDLKFRFRGTFFGSTFESSGSNTFATNQETVFAYSNIQLPRDVTWTLGLSYDDFKQENIHLQKVNPKIGLQWNVMPRYLGPFDPT
jgi:hypothetical protein